MNRYVVLAGAVVAMVPATASAMTVAEFLAKVDTLEARGMAAMFSPDLKLVTTEIKTAAPAYRADAAKARAAGRVDLGCPPVTGKLGVTSDEVVRDFRAIPVAQRTTLSVRQAFYTMMRKRFTCR